ncbi:7084_t:CDS:1 [Cetraspora pellucida]|uniref:7084_t:CDS:1 n=1 Tax=Cetraspora pellucida TaxID=1433469 RepID=A0A9N9PKD6_9GLOM|nr:7084_t:CDS:1 [Cetraspora pellucida]
MLDTIVENTNLYALTKGAGVIGRQWLDLSHKELIIWIALVIYQELYRLSSLDQYWNEDEKLPLYHISKQMSLKHFEIIKRFLHISSPAVTINNYFEKLESLLSHIRNVSKQLYVPNSNVSVDEMVIRFSGRSIHTVRIKNKPILEGFKILSLCESGYTYTFLPTSCVSPNNVMKMYGLSKTGCLVYHLVEQLPYSEFSFNIYMDNYFTSILLFQYLRQINIGACGTIRKTSSGFPKELKIDKNIKLNWDIHTGIIINGALVVFWQDNGLITMLTTIHRLIGDEWEVERERRQPRETSTNAVKVRAVFGTKSKKKLKIPRVIDDYNNYMNGVDVADQL